jgi:hypothetical protein
MILCNTEIFILTGIQVDLLSLSWQFITLLLALQNSLMTYRLKDTKDYPEGIWVIKWNFMVITKVENL